MVDKEALFDKGADWFGENIPPILWILLLPIALVAFLAIFILLPGRIFKKILPDFGD